MILKIGEMLIEKGLITPEQLEIGMEEQRKSGELLGRILVKKGFLKEEEFLKILSETPILPRS